MYIVPISRLIPFLASILRIPFCCGFTNKSAHRVVGPTFCLVALLISSCTKDPDPSQPVARPGCKVIKSAASSLTGNTATEYSYDNKDRLTQSVTYRETKKAYNYDYEYNQNDQIIKYIFQSYHYGAGSNVTVVTHTYIPEHNQIGQATGYKSTSVSTDPTIPQTTATVIFEYDSQGNRTNITTQGSDGASTVELHEYYNGNCIKSTYRAGEPAEFSVSYEYYLDQENKSRTLAHVGFLGPNANQNLVKKATKTSTHSSGTIDIRNYSYALNEKGYPVKTTTAFYNGWGDDPATSITTFEYACK